MYMFRDSKHFCNRGMPTEISKHVQGSSFMICLHIHKSIDSIGSSSLQTDTVISEFGLHLRKGEEK